MTAPEPKPLRWRRESEYGGHYATTNGRWQVEQKSSGPDGRREWVLYARIGAGSDWVDVANHRTKAEAQADAAERARVASSGDVEPVT